MSRSGRLVMDAIKDGLTMSTTREKDDKPPPLVDGDAPLTIAEFCKRYGISTETYRRMRLRGETPVETRISPRRPLILIASIREWERRRFWAGQ